MAINKDHIKNIFQQKFSLLDYTRLVAYFEDQRTNDEVKQEIQKQWDQFEPDSHEQEDLNPLFYKLYYSIDQQESKSNTYQKVRRFTRIAAILVFGLLFASIVYYAGKNSKSQYVQPIEFVSQTGFRNQFELPDGTIGWLGQGSDLKFHLNNKNERVVDLDGLAFFSVAHNKKQPFIVNTPSKLSIQVLGTKFNVSSYPTDPSCEVVLEKGSVSLSLNGKTIDKMTPNDRVEFNSENKSYKKSKVNVADYVAWKDGKLVLNDVSLEEACAKLGHFYNVDFEMQTKGLESQKIRMVLEKESLNDALNLLGMLAPVKCQVEEPTIQKDYRLSKKKIIVKNK